MLTLKDRLLRLFETQDMTQKQFGELIGIGQSTLHNYLNGLTEPNFKNILMLLNSFPNINANWLLRGVGDMYIHQDNSTNTIIKSMNQLNELNEDTLPYEPQKKLLQENELNEKRYELLLIEMEALRKRLELVEKEVKKKK